MVETVAICVPTNPYGPTAPWQSFIALKDYMNDFNNVEARFFSISAQPIDLCRNMIVSEVNKLYNGHPDWYLWIDSDQEILFNVFERLKKHDKDIISALIPKRMSPYNFCAHFKGSKYKGNIRVGIGKKNYFTFENAKTLIDKIKNKELMEVNAVGFGCILIKGEVFNKMKDPYFYMTKDKKGRLNYGEDINFCRNATKVGYKIYLDCSTNVGHYGPIFPNATFAAFESIMKSLDAIPLNKNDVKIRPLVIQ